jgi:Domain of unknown function (DUF4832)/Domain of unknown function (DUF4874)
VVLVMTLAMTGCGGVVGEVVDGSVADAGQVDAGATDAGTTDAGVADAGVPVVVTFTPMSTTTLLPNPDRGYAGWAGADLIDSYDSGSVAAGFAAGNRLLSCEIDSLSAFRTSAISATWLTAFQARLNSIRAAGMKCALNLRYDNTSAGNDATATQIVAHLAQLKQILQANADVIPFAKAGFIGAWGEWHSSKNGNSCGYNSTTPCAVANPNRVIIRDAVLDAFHPLTYVHFRYPDDFALWFAAPLTLAQAFTNSTQGRAAFHNDCQVSSSNDTGTWLGVQSGQSSAQLQTMMATTTQFVPYGGEVSGSCAVPRTDCASARADFAQWHLAWLKDSIDSTDSELYRVGWTAGGCLAEIRNTMGYRVQLDQLRHPRSVSAGGTAMVTVALRNVGWARVFSPRVLVVSACLNSTCVTGSSAQDLRSVPAQGTGSTEFSVALPFPQGAAKGEYQLRLSAPDVWPNTANQPAFSLRFANTDSGAQAWNAAGYLVTGSTLTVN